MGNDLQTQAESLKKLPPSFWQSLKKQEKELVQATDLIVPPQGNQPPVSLQSSLKQTLDLEEPIVLKIYVPLIRRLRVEWTERALDFYVMVKAHIARLERVVQAYSGDPAASQRCVTLFQNFEKEVQEPAVVEAKFVKKGSKKAIASKHTGKAAADRRLKAAAKKQPPRSLKTLPKRAKPLVKKIEITRRRARR